MKTTRQIYCQYLLSSQINYTCTNLAEHLEGLDHNSVYRYLKTEKLTPRLLWEKARETIVQSDVPLMTRIHKAGKLFYYPIKKNRLVDETRGQEPYRGVESLSWTATQEQQGKLVKVKGFAQDRYLKLF